MMAVADGTEKMPRLHLKIKRFPPAPPPPPVSYICPRPAYRAPTHLIETPDQGKKKKTPLLSYLNTVCSSVGTPDLACFVTHVRARFQGEEQQCEINIITTPPSPSIVRQPTPSNLVASDPTRVDGLAIYCTRKPQHRSFAAAPSLAGVSFLFLLCTSGRCA